MSQDYLTLTAFVQKAEDITNIPGLRHFRGDDARGYFEYNTKLNALDGMKVNLIVLDPGMPYDYIVEATGGIRVRADWLETIEYDVEWAAVPIDEVIEVSTGSGNWYPMHFAGYDPDNPNSKPYLTFQSGRSSKTALDLQEVIHVTLSDWENLGGKHFLFYSEADSFYIWFNLDENNSDPGGPNGPLDGLGYTGVEIKIQTGEPADSIASSVQQEIDAISDFSAAVSTEDNRIVEITVEETGKVYDATPENSNLTIQIKMQGGDIVSWSMARPILP